MPTPEEVEAYRKNADALIKARTEQLRDAFGKIERLADAMKAAIGAPDFDTAKNLLRTVIEKEVPKPSPAPRFGGEPGTPVPEVDADDVKAASRLYCEVEKDHPGQQVAVGMEVLKRVCKPGADVHAVCYCYAQLALLKLIAEQNVIPKASMDCITANGEFKDSALEVISKFPMEWMGNGPRQGLPFDLERFLQLCAA